MNEGEREGEKRGGMEEGNACKNLSLKEQNSLEKTK